MENSRLFSLLILIWAQIPVKVTQNLLLFINYKDVQTQAAMKAILQAETPDLVVSSGDNLFTNGGVYETPGWYASHYQSFVQPMIDLNIPWAITTGNHDIHGDLDQVGISSLDRSYSLSRTLPPAGDFILDFNYILPIYDNAGTDIQYRLWFLDTGDLQCGDVYGYNCFRQDQINWVKEESAKIADSDPSKGRGMMIFHITLQQFMDLINENEYYGRVGEIICCQAQDTGMFKVIKDYKTVDWVACGHDHDSDFYGYYKGIGLSYGRKTGYTHYGPKKLQHGARVFEIQISPTYEIKTWIRNEDGSIENQTKTKRSIFTPKLKECCEAVTPYSISKKNVIQTRALDKIIKKS
ncbi:UNKNOWN [Stylonychia lemnae]|uniref:Calcineurin-like phosphoesterase domain-containing protein n=1 Tax=Stylonychia lemnae TaxID=5949 RepID=A0A078AEM5_STYLE|nr:UNKNOWN [Stylonychia lemnae]|eukprot:CDW80724.1 UNKNOWN [Stylonychia lemnae]